MGLPPALAARLAKRGLITQTEEKQESNDDEEEVIAENYDAPSAADDNNDEFGNLLPPDWEKVFNPEHGTWYYWEVSTGKVSWLPPSDPEAFITYPAGSKLAEVDPPPPMISVDSIPLPPSMPAPPPARDDSRGKRDAERSNQRSLAAKKKRATNDDEFDPMDPSSYSDAPKGNWGTGLKKLDDAKTGVDSTANGPLFQQRPYPSPGEVLRRNTQARQEVGPAKPWQ